MGILVVLAHLLPLDCWRSCNLLFFLIVCFLSLLVHVGDVSAEMIFKEVRGPSVDFTGFPYIRQKTHTHTHTHTKHHMITDPSEIMLSVSWPLAEMNEEQCP